jgi:hypothetical protein
MEGVSKMAFARERQSCSDFDRYKKSLAKGRRPPIANPKKIVGSSESRLAFDVPKMKCVQPCQEHNG